MCPLIGLAILFLPLFTGSLGTFPDDLVPVHPGQVVTCLDEPPDNRRRP